MCAMTPRQKQGIMAICQDSDGNFYYNDKLDGIWGKKSQKAAERFMRDFTGEEAVPVPETSNDFWDDIEFFKRDEFRCKCGGLYCHGFPVEPDPELIRILEKIRAYFGKPVRINSGVRCAAHNSSPAVGGATQSQHLKGTAADITVDGVEPSRVAMYAETLLPKTGGIGRYKAFTHIDVRSVKARWNG